MIRPEDERPGDSCDDGRESAAEGTERRVALPLPPRPGGRANGSIVMAAMVGISEALGFDKPQTVIEVSAASGEGLDLDFGDLPPLA